MNADHAVVAPSPNSTITFFRCVLSLMAEILASNCSCFRDLQLVNKGRIMDDLSFSSSVCIRKFERHEGTFLKIERFHRFQVEMHQTGSPMKHGINGQPVKLGTNGEAVNFGANGKPVNVDSNASRVKKETTPALVNSMIVREPTGFPPSEELKVLPSDESFSWANENYNSVQRTIDVWSFVLSLCVRVLFDDSKWSYPGGFTEGKQISRRRKTASWLRERVLQLGPTFIKIGQLSSTRLDLFPREIVDELAKLQDRVPTFSSTKAKGFIERELGAPVHVLFKEFEDQPIAATSLGQRVKPFIPGNLKLIAEYFQSSENLGSPTRDWIGIYEECAKILYEEIDYVNEAKSSERFSREFRNIKWVCVPQVFWDHTANKVLTLEYVPGIKINKSASSHPASFILPASYSFLFSHTYTPPPSPPPRSLHNCCLKHL
ncbi:hypothetical protein L6452_28409 [Arctium lappa]|uniref:Uncharacterized protein n=1 Tax=Arctium lappa TaxID=4217 RepID=A0ACB8ZYV8_ARCLA|nr:hypothetical protein L6452_28409 [Arctium lappa]